MATKPALIWPLMALLALVPSIQMQSLRGTSLVVTTVIGTPYTMLREDYQAKNLTGNDKYEGYIVDLMQEIAEVLGFTYYLKLSDDGKYGMIDSTGKWTGMIGEVIDNRAQIAAASLTITRNREEVVDFTQPFMNLGIGVIHKRETLDPLSGTMHACGLIAPFEHYSTDAFLAVALILGLVLLILRRKHKTIFFRVLLGLWLLILFVFAALFIAQLSAYYVADRVHKPIEGYERFSNIEELSRQSDVEYGTVPGGSTQAFFRNSNYSTYARMWSHMSAARPQPFVESNGRGIEKVKGGNYAFILESPSIDYVLERECGLYQVGGLLDSKGYGLAVAQGKAPMREELSMAILRLQESGRLAELKHKWWSVKNGGGQCTR